MKAVWTRREVILLPPIIVGLVVLPRLQEMLRLIDLSLRKAIHIPPQLRSRPQFDPKWVQLLKLRFESGYTDKAIAKRMGISDRTVRNYWTKIGDALDIFYDRDNDIPSLIGSKARKLGLID